MAPEAQAQSGSFYGNDYGIRQVSETQADRSASEHWDRLKRAWEEDQAARRALATQSQVSPAGGTQQAGFGTATTGGATAGNALAMGGAAMPASGISDRGMAMPPMAGASEFRGLPANPVSIRGLQDPLDPLDAPVQPIVERPSDLKKITEINPFYNYEPDPTIRMDDPSLNLCPDSDMPYFEDDLGQQRQCPPIVSLSDEGYMPRAFPAFGYCWLASNYHHNPLYFENAPLERYGHTHHCLVEPFASVGLFGGQLLGLPYQMTIDPICDCVYSLGWYRPGECAPKLLYQVPLSGEAAAVEAGVATGLFFLIP